MDYGANYWLYWINIPINNNVHIYSYCILLKSLIYRFNTFSIKYDNIVSIFKLKANKRRYYQECKK